MPFCLYALFLDARRAMKASVRAEPAVDVLQKVGGVSMAAILR